MSGSVHIPDLKYFSNPQCHKSDKDYINEIEAYCFQKSSAKSLVAFKMQGEGENCLLF